MISCVVYLYHYLPSSSRTFTVEKENTIHITKGHYSSGGSIVNNANVRISSSRRSQSTEEGVDDTIYIDNENYGDESYDNSGNFANQVADRPNEIPVTAPVTIIERPVERSQLEDDDIYYENYEDDSEADDEDIVSSGDGKIVVNVKKPVANRIVPPVEPVNYIENVYSVSSEIVSNLKSQYSVEDTKQINKPDKSNLDAESERDDSSDDEYQEEGAKGKRLSGNNKSLVERSRQLLLCESARTGELCRMLFKGTAG